MDAVYLTVDGASRRTARTKYHAAKMIDGGLLVTACGSLRVAPGSGKSPGGIAEKYRCGTRACRGAWTEPA